MIEFVREDGQIVWVNPARVLAMSPVGGDGSLITEIVLGAQVFLRVKGNHRTIAAQLSGNILVDMKRGS